VKEQLVTYPNGFRLMYICAEAPVSHCVLMIGAGGVNEPVGKAGLAHFIEHMLFKGTSRRKAYQVMNRLEVVGGELNAFTTKEETCVHATVLNMHVGRAVELIADVIFNSVFPEKEIIKEKEVILDEINSYLDQPAEQIFDDFECMVFEKTPLGKPVLGTPASVSAFSKSDLTQFVKKNYAPSQMVFAYSGPVPFETISKMVGEYFKIGRTSHRRINRPHFIKSSPGSRIFNKKTSHLHHIQGTTSFAGNSPRRFQMFLMNNILGGPGMNSRLNMEVREKHGFTYHIESGYTPYRYTGLFHFYFACESKNLEKCKFLIQREFKRLCNNRISETQLTRYKNQLKGQVAIGQENRLAMAINHAKSLLHYNRPVNTGDVFKQIDAVTSEQIMEVANRFLNPEEHFWLQYN
jgi:predicted Zn-dependent peptidase